MNNKETTEAFIIVYEDADEENISSIGNVYLNREKAQFEIDSHNEYQNKLHFKNRLYASLQEIKIIK